MLYINKAIILVGIVILINFTSPWFYKIIQEQLVIGLILLLLSIGLSLSITQLATKLIVFLSGIGLLVVTIFFTFNNIEADLFKHIALDIHTTKVRQGYYNNRFGSWIHNDNTLSFYKYQRNFFTNLNFNQFFFGGEPRLRPYALDFEKFSIFHLGIFLLGLFSMAKSGKKKLLMMMGYSFVILLILAFANPSFNLGLYPLYPLITSFISFGAYNFILKVKNLKLLKYD